MLVRNADLAGQIRDLRIREGRFTEIGAGLENAPGEEVLEADGGALLPGLHDHHLHLHALAAALASVACGPPNCPDSAALTRALRGALPNDGWIRGTGYFESVAGPLDRAQIDEIRSDVPIRIQHRSGVMWFLNSRALEVLGIGDRNPAFQGGAGGPALEQESIERDVQGRATGRLFRADRWLRDRLPNGAPPDLTGVGRLLASFGVTRVTDATPSNTEVECALFRSAQASGALPQHVEMMGDLARATFEVHPGGRATLASLRLGAHKIMLDEPALPDLEALAETIRLAHDHARPVAIHTVTRAEIHFALAALDLAGARLGDRLEHASVAPPEAVEVIRRLGIRVVTQPNFIGERGDHYRSQVEPRDQAHLYRVRSWQGVGVTLAGGTDAPFGDPDPWKAMRAAVDRRTPLGEVLGADERVSPESALALFRRDLAPDPGSDPQGPLRFAVGDVADGCLLSLPWSKARDALSSQYVAATLRAGELVYRA